VPLSSAILEAEDFSETLLLFYQTARRHIQNDCNLTDTFRSYKMHDGNISEKKLPTQSALDSCSLNLLRSL
jgi:hypothetical protein